MESLPAYRQASRRIGSIAVAVLAMLIATTGTSSAQTWHWQYVAHPANSQPINAQSTVVLSPSEVSIEYTAPIEHRNAVIESCRVTLSDVQHVTAVRTHGPIFLVIQLKPQREANCDSGRRPVAAIPGDDFNIVNQVATAINQACCTAKGPPPVARAAAPSPSAKPRVAARPSAPPSAKPRVVAQATPTPAPPPTPTPTPPPTPAPTATPATPAPSPTPRGPRVTDWVENQGLFMFVRIRNSGKQPVTIDSGEVLDCKNVDIGCGPFTRRITLDPYSTATIATVASTGQVPSFSYRYSADQGKFTGGGSSTKAPPARAARMSAQAIRVAEAAAIGALRSPTPGPAQQAPEAYTYTAPRLLKRGSSKLGIGQTGTALVRVQIAANGAPQEATIVSITNDALTAAAIETAVSSTYAPAMRNGQTVPAKYVATFTFNGEDPATAAIPVWRRSAPPPAAPSPSPGPSAAASASSTRPPQNSPH